MNATGAARIRGHGVATTSTSANRIASPDRHHAAPAMSSATAVNGTAYRSASRTIGARLDAASATSATICWYWLSFGRRVTSSSTALAPLTPPLSTSSPATRSSGMLSPVSDDSSKTPDSLSRVPSAGTTSLGRTISRSPGSTSSSGTSRIAPSSPTTCATRGACDIRAVRSRRARPAANSSSASPPVSIRTTTVAAQYSRTATVAQIAVTASRSTPSAPDASSRTIDTADRSAIARAKIPRSHGTADGRTAASTPAAASTTSVAVRNGTCQARLSGADMLIVVRRRASEFHEGKPRLIQLCCDCAGQGTTGGRSLCAPGEFLVPRHNNVRPAG